MALDVEKELATAVRHFWRTRARQSIRQGSVSGRKDAGNRGAVTGGKHADGFVELICAILRDAGLRDFSVEKRSRTLPGFYRPTKEWDLVVVAGGNLVAAIEVKSQVGSFGNNFNNRVEEALGSATDFWAAYAQGRFAGSARPWLGYLFMLEANDSSMRDTKRVELRPFAVDEAFQELSYARRYEEVCRRLVRERLYDAACFFTSDAASGLRGRFHEPAVELSIRNFSIGLHARVLAFARYMK
jgi:hypothetical protein